MDLQPLFSRIIVRAKDIEKVGSIFIPLDSKQMKATEGEVIAVGSECSIVKIGDNIFYGKYSGAEIERCDKKYIIMNEEDVLCFINKK